MSPSLTTRELLPALGWTVRQWRTAKGWTRQALAERAGVSLRFLAHLESGAANISVTRLGQLAETMELSLGALLWTAEGIVHSRSAAGDGLNELRVELLRGLAQDLGAAPTEHLREAQRFLREISHSDAPPPLIALVGLRGAGKSTLGPSLAKALGIPFRETDDIVVERCGLQLPELFEMHGESYYRETERQALRQLVNSGQPTVVAASGGVVTDAEAFSLLREKSTLVWVKTTPEQHMGRVEAQGDSRPMRNRPNAMSELKTLLRQRRQFYQQARIVVDTSAAEVQQSLAQLQAALTKIGYPPRVEAMT